ncbi:MAG: biotin carboxylase N-terminal domain-containing protein, partial [Bdellovibrionota bacterium]
MKTISRVLIANRGEIAARIARTVRKMGMIPIVVYSEADLDSLAVREIRDGRALGEAFLVGPADARNSYLNSERVLEIAARSKADAIHPGYGFLSEDSAFARNVIRAGLTWIGPSPEAMEQVSSKSRAKALAESLGIPVLPGFRETQDLAAFKATAEKIGYPILLKATAGGGGRGIRKVTSAAELDSQFELARSEAERSFGDGELLLEKYVERAHHVEVQIFGDEHGHVIHLGDRDCSAQRRHQKIIEESPSPSIDADLRSKLHEAAVKIAKTAKYTSAGTVEFLVEEDAFYFLEINTRLQVEHPVTEAVTGVDLVELQLRVAQGEALSLQQASIAFCGHSIELRLCAEDPSQGFRPSTGRIRSFSFTQDVRDDHGLTS